MEQEINGKVQKINDEDYEIIKIIESFGTIKAVEWYQENYDCEVSEAINAIKAIGVKYNVHYNGSEDSDDKAIIEMYNSKFNYFELVKWYKEIKKIEIKEAKDKVDLVLHIAGLRDINTKNSSGCMITILIAITSTLSIGSLIAYCI